jgi:hypothetical protein
MDVIMVGNVIELADILNRRHYTKDATAIEQEEENVIRWRYRLFAKWFIMNYTTYVGDKLVNPGYIFKRSLVQFMAAISSYVKSSPNSTGIKGVTPLLVQSKISHFIRRCYNELFREYARILGKTASDFSWIGPDITVSKRDKDRPLSSDPMDLDSDPVYHEVWEDEEKSSDDDEGPEDETSKHPGENPNNDNRNEAEDYRDGEKPDGEDMDVDKPDDETPGDERKQEGTSALRHVQPSPGGMRSKLRKRVRHKQDESNDAGTFCLPYFIYYLLIVR